MLDDCRSRLLVATCLAALVSPAAVAQSAPEQPAAEDRDIIVTARRVEERLQDVPISITVLSQQQISNRNITTASELGTYTPSLTSNSRFGPDKSSFTIRGFNQDTNTSPTVGVYFADVVALRAAAGTASGNGAGPGSFFDLQNIQVLKGPQGTLFGRNTTGGAILLVPRKPTDKFEGYVEGSVGNFDMRRGQAVLNVPIGDTIRARFGVDRQVRDGYLRNRSGVGPRAFGDIDYVALRGGLVIDFTPQIENYTVATYNKSDTNGTSLRNFVCQRDPAQRAGRAVLVAPFACAQIDRQNARGDGYYDVENVVANPYTKNRQWQAINTTTWHVSDTATLKNIVSYGEFRERLNTDIGGEYFIATAGALAGQSFGATVLSNAPGGDSAAQSTFTEELQLQGHALDSRLTYQAGGYFEDSKPQGLGNTSYSASYLICADVLALRCTTAVNGLAGLSLVYNKVAFRNIGFYGQGTFDLTDKLAVTAGLRYTIDRTRGSGQRVQVTFPTANNPVGACANPALSAGVPTLNPANCASALFTQKSQKPTWLIDAEYKPIPDVMMYLKYSRGYRQGGVNPSIIGLETWKPEKVDTYEIGAKTSFRGAVPGYFNITGFYNDFRNQQLTATAIGRIAGVPGTLVVVNAGKSRIWGLEVDASVSPFHGFKLDAGYAYLNTKLLEFAAPPLPASAPYNPPNPPKVGGDLPLSPHHRITVTGTYTLPLDRKVGKVSVGATYTYTSHQFATDQSPYGFLPTQTLVNLNLNWESVASLPVDLSLFVTNVTKEKFYLNLGNSFTGSGYEGVVPNLPRMYGLRLRYRFGKG